MPDFDPAMLQQIMSLLGAGGPMGSAIQNYVPRTSVRGFDEPYQGASLGAILAPLGAMAQTAGGFGDLFGQTNFPQLMARLQSGPNADVMLMARQQQIARETMRLSTQITGTQVVRGLGIDPTSKFGQGFAAAMPMIEALAPDMAADMFSMVAPGTITRSGAQRLVSASMIQDPMGRLSTANMDGLRSSFMRTFTNPDGMRNNQALHGFTLDEAALFTQYAADNGLIDQDFDRRAARGSISERILKDKFGGRKRDALNADEQKDLDRNTQTELDSEALVRGSSNQMKIARQIQQMTGMNAAGAAGLMQQLGIDAGDSKESTAITGLLRELDALGHAAGLTTQNMLNAGRALQAANGGDLLFNTRVAAMTGMAARMAKTSANAAGLSVDMNALDATSSGIQDVMGAVAGSAFKDTEATVARLGNSEQKARMYALKKAAADDTTGAGALKYAKYIRDLQTGNIEGADPELAKIVYGAGLDEATLAAARKQEGNEEAAAGISAGIVEARGVAALNLEGLDEKSSALKRIFNRQGGREAYARIFAKMNAGQRGYEDVAEEVGDDKDMREALAAGNRRGTPEYLIAHANFVSAAWDNGGKARVEQDAKRAEIAQKVRDASVHNQGVIPTARTSGIHSIEDLLEATQFGVTKEMMAAVQGFSDDDQTAMIEAGNKRVAAMAILDNKDASEKDRTQAAKDLDDANSVLSEHGLDPTQQHTEDVKAKAEAGAASIAPPSSAGDSMGDGSAQGTKAEVLKALIIKAGAGAGSADNKLHGSTAPSGKDEAPVRKAGDPDPDKQMAMKIEVEVKQNGQPATAGDATVRIVETKGFRATLDGSK